MDICSRRFLKVSGLLSFFLLSSRFIITGDLSFELIAITLLASSAITIASYSILLIWRDSYLDYSASEYYDAFEAGISSKEELAIFKLKYPDKEVNLPEDFKGWLLRVDIHLNEMVMNEKFVSIRDKEVS